MHPDTGAYSTCHSIMQLLGYSGRWWLVGSAWSGHTPTASSSSSSSSTSSSTTAATADDDDDEGHFGSVELQTLAKQMRMNTDIRRTIFFVVMGSTDFMDCFEKLQKLNLRGKQEREIVRVLLECCAQEAVYNAYYAHVAQKLCVFESSFRFTFQLAFWDHFKQFESMPPRRASNLAKLLAHLMAQGTESPAMLKVWRAGGEGGDFFVSGRRAFRDERMGG
jgi:nucleolar MIF4G domain-containing protein 1